MKLYNFLFVFILFIAEITQANIIRDSEIEETIDLIIAPLRKVSSLDDLKIYIINDTNPNAFTIGGNEIFITSSLIINYPDPDILRGVVAHEIGHILGHHVLRKQEAIDNYTKAAMGATALGIATAISGGAGEGMAIAMAGMHFSERSIYSHSRAFESTADQTALRLLEKSGNSSIGLIKFFEKMQHSPRDQLLNVYDQTHPLSNDRLLVMRGFNKRSKFPNSQNTEQIIYKYKRSAAKLAAFTLDIEKILDCTFEENVDETTQYMKAIKCFRIGNFDDALNHINSLIMKYPKDPYYHELKGQIYFEAGKKGALNEYEIAESTRPKDILIKLGKAIVGITLYKEDTRKLARYHEDLELILKKEPNNLLALYYMAICYEEMGFTGKSYLNTAIIALKTGRTDDAKKMAKAAIKLLPKRSPSWYKAEDIISFTEKQ